MIRHHFRGPLVMIAATIALFSALVAAQTTPPTAQGAESATGLSRIAGSDRYALSAAVSASTFDSHPQYAFVASGEKFPDALATDSRGLGPVLLVTRDTVPEAVAAELARLKPGSIFVMGGVDSVSTAVEAALSSYAPVTRIDGADRYAVSAAMAATIFKGIFVPVIYVASGEVFPDALSGAAGLRADGPLLLVQRDGIPSSVAAELDRHETFEIDILGGANSINDATFAAISAYASPTTRVNRIDGADRYAVSAALSEINHPSGASTVYVASGAVFPDALSGAPAAIVDRAPILLLTKDSIPDAVKTELDRLNPRRIVVLGGPNTISEALMPELAKYIFTL